MGIRLLMKGFSAKTVIVTALLLSLVYVCLLRSADSSQQVISTLASKVRQSLPVAGPPAASPFIRKSAAAAPPIQEVRENNEKEAYKILANAEKDSKDVKKEGMVKASVLPKRTRERKKVSSKYNHTVTVDENGYCPLIGNNTDLVGHIPQSIVLIPNIKEGEIEAIYQDVLPGGNWKPKDCKARYKVAIILPYRDRQTHLTRLLAFLLPILKKQRLDFRFIVTEQFGNDLFNKGRIMNAAFEFAEQLGVDCVAFHDVDMFPQDDRTPYHCQDAPMHLGAFVNSLGYQLMYYELVGGVLIFRMNHFRALNGYSNLFWGWGGEDDDMGARIMALNYTILRPDNNVARFSMIKHTKRQQEQPKIIRKLLKNSGSRLAIDGLNVTANWSIRKVILRPLYYHLYVDVGDVPKEWIKPK